jgi:hypothetical protein
VERIRKDKQFPLRLTKGMHKSIRLYVAMKGLSMQGWIEMIIDRELRKEVKK